MNRLPANTRVIPALFVFLWSTGFIGAKFGLPNAEPFTFLGIRMLITLAALAMVIRVMGIRWSGDRHAYLHLAGVGLLVHGCYLGGVFSAIDRGMDASMVAIIVGLQPLVTAVAARVWLGESLTARKGVGLVLGFLGIALVLGGRGGSSGQADATSLLFCLVALFGISLGTLYQKRKCASHELLTGTFVQYVATALMMGLLAFSLESREIIWDLRFTMALLWLVFALSMGAILLLMYMIRQGEAGRVASLFYLVPPLTAVETYFLFGERLTPASMGGIVLCMIGVYLVLKSRPPPYPGSNR